jgi:hypothetical protein
MATGFSEFIHAVPVMALAQTSDNDGVATSQFVDMSDVISLEFLVTLNTLASSASTTATVWGFTVLATSTVTAAGAAIAFDYRLSGVVGADTWGTITAVSADVAANMDSDCSDSLLIIHVDPSVVAAAGDDKRYVYLSCSGASAEDNGPNGSYSAIALVLPRHAQATMQTTTA